MNRIIKFRVWDKFNAVYSYSDNYKNLASFFAYIENLHTRGNCVVIEQFIGLKDKNEKEIYEGDILKVKLNSLISEFAPVEYRKDGFFWYGYSVCSIIHEADIVGNIYQNPELIKEK